MKRHLIVITVVFCLSSPAEAQMVVGTFSGSVTYSTPPINGYVAYIDISGGKVQPVVTPPLAPRSICAQRGLPVALTDTVSFAHSQSKVVLAINANLGPELPHYVAGVCGRPYGLLKSNGLYLNPIEIVMGTTGPSLLFYNNSNAMIGTPSQSDGQRAKWAVSGWAGGNGGGTALLIGGHNDGSTAQPVATTIAPRVGAGITKDRKTLILAMVNGVESSYIGLWLSDFADLFKGLGAWDAVNLDGGGSSTFLYLPSANIVQSQSLLTLFNDAGPVSGNPNGFTWKLTMVEANQTCISYPNGNVTNLNQLCLNTPGEKYRPIYANLGFVIVK